MVLDCIPLIKNQKRFKNDLPDFIAVRKVAGENMGNVLSPRWYLHQPQNGRCFFHPWPVSH